MYFLRGSLPWPPRGRIRLEGVGVLSREGRPILHDIVLDLRPGQSVLLAGSSGAGKSTLIDVLAGLRPVDEGVVRVGERRLEELSPEEFRAQVTLVSAHCFLFRGTLRQNLELGRPRRSMSLEEALRAAEMDERVESLPQGLDTLVKHAIEG